MHSFSHSSSPLAASPKGWGPYFPSPDERDVAGMIAKHSPSSRPALEDQPTNRSCNLESVPSDNLCPPLDPVSTAPKNLYNQYDYNSFDSFSLRPRGHSCATRVSPTTDASCVPTFE